jgi:hypothetical protein
VVCHRGGNAEIWWESTGDEQAVPGQHSSPRTWHSFGVAHVLSGRKLRELHVMLFFSCVIEAKPPFHEEYNR